MSYISQEDYKDLMNNFQKGSPKGLLKEELEKEGNAFTAGLAKTKKGGEFKVGDKEVKDTSNYDASIKEGICPACGMPANQCQCGQEMDESGTGDNPFDFYKSAIESASGDKISHSEEDDYDRTIYFSAMNPNVTYYMGDNHDIIRYDGETGERYSIGSMNDYDEPTPDNEPDTDADYEEPRDDFDMAEVKKLKELAGVKSHDDGPEDEDSEEDREAGRRKREMDDEEAENAERDEFDENAEGKLNLRDPLAAAKNVASKYKAELKPKFDEYQKSHEEYMQAIRKYDNTDPEFREIIKVHNALVKAFQGNVLGLARQEMEDAGEKPVVAKNLAYGYSDEDWPSEFVTALNKELKGMAEGLHMPPLQATGNTVMTNEDQAPFGMSVLSPDEREQLKEYINHYKTIKSEISKLLEKAGKSGRIMENAKKAEDENVPAERKAKYRNPTEVPVQHKKSNLGGNRTGLVMTKGEMYENEGQEEGQHERIQGMLDTKLHDAFYKVTGMIMNELMANGFDEGEIKNFLQHEIDEKAREAVNAQHDL